jgi:hypothetical protein
MFATLLLHVFLHHGTLLQPAFHSRMGTQAHASGLKFYETYQTIILSLIEGKVLPF